MLNFPDKSNRRHHDARGVAKDRRVAKRHNLFVITDEIYSELTFEGEHVSIASLPGMRERTDFPARIFQGVRHDRIPHRLRLRPAPKSSKR